MPYFIMFEDLDCNITLVFVIFYLTNLHVPNHICHEFIYIIYWLSLFYSLFPSIMGAVEWGGVRGISIPREKKRREGFTDKHIYPV